MMADETNGLNKSPCASCTDVRKQLVVQTEFQRGEECKTGLIVRGDGNLGIRRPEWLTYECRLMSRYYGRRPWPKAARCDSACSDEASYHIATATTATYLDISHNYVI